MFILDDILMAPIRGLRLVFEEIHHAVDSQTHDTQSVVESLQDLYMQLETGKITEAEFDEREAKLLDELDRAEGLPAEEGSPEEDGPDESSRGESDESP